MSKFVVIGIDNENTQSLLDGIRNETTEGDVVGTAMVSCSNTLTLSCDFGSDGDREDNVDLNNGILAFIATYRSMLSPSDTSYINIVTQLLDNNDIDRLSDVLKIVVGTPGSVNTVVNIITLAYDTKRPDNVASHPTQDVLNRLYDICNSSLKSGKNVKVMYMNNMTFSGAKLNKEIPLHRTLYRWMCVSSDSSFCTGLSAVGGVEMYSIGHSEYRYRIEDTREFYKLTATAKEYEKRLGIGFPSNFPTDTQINQDLQSKQCEPENIDINANYIDNLKGLKALREDYYEIAYDYSLPLTSNRNSVTKTKHESAEYLEFYVNGYIQKRKEDVKAKTQELNKLQSSKEQLEISSPNPTSPDVKSAISRLEIEISRKESEIASLNSEIKNLSFQHPTLKEIQTFCDNNNINVSVVKSELDAKVGVLKKFEEELCKPEYYNCCIKALDEGVTKNLPSNVTYEEEEKTVYETPDYPWYKRIWYRLTDKSKLDPIPTTKKVLNKIVTPIDEKDELKRYYSQLESAQKNISWYESLCGKIKKLEQEFDNIRERSQHFSISEISLIDIDKVRKYSPDYTSYINGLFGRGFSRNPDTFFDEQFFDSFIVSHKDLNWDGRSQFSKDVANANVLSNMINKALGKADVHVVFRPGVIGNPHIETCVSDNTMLNTSAGNVMPNLSVNSQSLTYQYIPTIKNVLSVFTIKRINDITDLRDSL